MATDLELLDAARRELEQTTVGFTDFATAGNPPSGHWGKGLAKLDQLRERLAPPVPALVYPHPTGTPGHAPPASDLHQTSGLAGNWALDFMAPGGTLVLAPEAGRIWKLSGHDPAGGVIGGDIFGWNVYIQTASGGIYFATHLGAKSIRLGQNVELGKVIGSVGHWPGNPGRSHTHLGYTSPESAKDAKEHIIEVAQAPRTTPAV